MSQRRDVKDTTWGKRKGGGQNQFISFIGGGNCCYYPQRRKGEKQRRAVRNGKREMVGKNMQPFIKMLDGGWRGKNTEQVAEARGKRGGAGLVQEKEDTKNHKKRRMDEREKFTKKKLETFNPLPPKKKRENKTCHNQNPITCRGNKSECLGRLEKRKNRESLLVN